MLAPSPYKQGFVPGLLEAATTGLGLYNAGRSQAQQQDIARREQARREQDTQSEIAGRQAIAEYHKAHAKAADMANKAAETAFEVERTKREVAQRMGLPDIDVTTLTDEGKRQVGQMFLGTGIGTEGGLLGSAGMGGGAAPSTTGAPLGGGMGTGGGAYTPGPGGMATPERPLTMTTKAPNPNRPSAREAASVGLLPAGISFAKNPEEAAADLAARESGGETSGMRAARESRERNAQAILQAHIARQTIADARDAANIKRLEENKASDDERKAYHELRTERDVAWAKVQSDLLNHAALKDDVYGQAQAVQNRVRFDELESRLDSYSRELQGRGKIPAGPKPQTSNLENSARSIFAYQGLGASPELPFGPEAVPRMQTPEAAKPSGPGGSVMANAQLANLSARTWMNNAIAGDLMARPGERAKERMTRLVVAGMQTGEVNAALAKQLYDYIETVPDTATAVNPVLPPTTAGGTPQSATGVVGRPPNALTPGQAGVLSQTGRLPGNPPPAVKTVNQQRLEADRAKTAAAAGAHAEATGVARVKDVNKAVSDYTTAWNQSAEAAKPGADAKLKANLDIIRKGTQAELDEAKLDAGGADTVKALMPKYFPSAAEFEIGKMRASVRRSMDERIKAKNAIVLPPKAEKKKTLFSTPPPITLPTK